MQPGPNSPRVPCAIIPFHSSPAPPLIQMGQADRRTPSEPQEVPGAAAVGPVTDRTRESAARVGPKADLRGGAPPIARTDVINELLWCEREKLEEPFTIRCVRKRVPAGSGSVRTQCVCFYEENRAASINKEPARPLRTMRRAACSLDAAQHLAFTSRPGLSAHLTGEKKTKNKKMTRILFRLTPSTGTDRLRSDTDRLRSE